MGAKPVDESKVAATVSNPYEDLSDEELELLAKHREEQARPVPPGTDAETLRVPFDTLVALHTGTSAQSEQSTQVPPATPDHSLIVDQDGDTDS